MQSTWTPSARLRATCGSLPNGAAWLARLPDTVRTLERRWSLTIHPPYDGDDAACSWVAPVVRADGTRAVLKIGVPHFEGEHEIDGLRFWAGDPTVRLLDADDEHNAMLLERCEPGTSLRAQPETEQDHIIAMLLRRLWRVPGSGHAFRRLSEQMSHWSAEARAVRERSSDIGLVDAGLALFDELPASAPDETLLITDLHAGNVLEAQREPWLAIDPKPFIGDPAFDATQHLLNCANRLVRSPHDTMRRFAELLEVDYERVHLWTFARAAVATAHAPWDVRARAFARALIP